MCARFAIVVIAVVGVDSSRNKQKRTTWFVVTKMGGGAIAQTDGTKRGEVGSAQGANVS